MTRRLFACLFLGLTAVSAADAKVFYCDPASGSPQGDGSEARPWRSLEEVLQADLVEICRPDGTSANAAAPVKAGDTIRLRNGWHGVVRIPGGFNPQPLTIAAQEGHRPQVGWIDVRDGCRWVVKGLTVSPSLSPRPLERTPRHLAMLGEQGGEKCSDLVIEDCFLYTVLDSTVWTAEDWVKKAANGIWLGRQGRAHVARNNYVLNTRFGISLNAPGCVAEGNVVANFSADGIRATRDRQVVQYNVIKNSFVGARDGDDNHDDGIQTFLFNVGTGTLRGIALRGNIVLQRESDGLPLANNLQGIGCFDGPLVDFVVEKNVVRVDHHHGVSLYDAQNCQIQDNACMTRDNRLRPWVMLGQKKKQADGNTVRNNLAHSFNFRADAHVTAANNEQVTPEAFQKKLGDLAAFIDGQYGKMHPAAQRPRLER